MLLAGGVTTMQYATLIFALPVTVVAYLVMLWFSKVLRMERAERQREVLRSRTSDRTGGAALTRSWCQRLENMRTLPSLKQVTAFLDQSVRPALDDVAAEFREQGYEVEQGTMASTEAGVDEPFMRVSMDAFRDFHYQVAVVETPVPTFGGRMSRETRVYDRLEVFTQTGSGGNDLMGLARQQLIGDVQDLRERD